MTLPQLFLAFLLFGSLLLLPLAELFFAFFFLGSLFLLPLAQLLLTFFFLGLFLFATLSLLFLARFFPFFVTCAASALWSTSAVPFSFRLLFGGVLANHERTVFQALLVGFAFGR